MATDHAKLTVTEVGPDVDSEVVYAVYKAEFELNPEPEERTHRLVILTLCFPDGRTMKVSLCPVIGRVVCGGIAAEADAYLEEHWMDF